MDVEVVHLVLRLRSGPVGVCWEKLWSEFERSGDLDLSEFSDDSEYGVSFTHIYASTQQKRSADTGDRAPG